MKWKMKIWLFSYQYAIWIEFKNIEYGKLVKSLINQMKRYLWFYNVVIIIIIIISNELLSFHWCFFSVLLSGRLSFSEIDG